MRPARHLDTALGHDVPLRGFSSVGRNAARGGGWAATWDARSTVELRGWAVCNSLHGHSRPMDSGEEIAGDGEDAATAEAEEAAGGGGGELVDDGEAREATRLGHGGLLSRAGGRRARRCNTVQYCSRGFSSSRSASSASSSSSMCCLAIRTPAWPMASVWPARSKNSSTTLRSSPIVS